MRIATAQQAIFVENARVLEHHAHAQGQYIMRLLMPRCAQSATPGQFIHLRCSENLPLRRPYSILHACAQEGWVDFMYQVVGKGSSFLASKKTGDHLNGIGPIGKPFHIPSNVFKPLLLGGGLGMPPILFLAHYLNNMNLRPMTLLASERPFPFRVSQSSNTQEIFKKLGAGKSLTILEKQGINGCLCSQQGYPGCFRGRIDTLADLWLLSLAVAERQRIKIFACGPAAMLKSVAALAEKHGIFCQVCVEEYMACGVGGCFGCTVQLVVNGKRTMQRVCVDGPVFCADEMYGSD